MESWGVWFAALPGLILFLYGIEQFSKEIMQVAGERFRSFLAASTKHPLLGALLGATVTGVTQSSTAATVITVGLVDAGMLSFAQSVGIILGTNVGTTVTAQLVAFKAMAFAPAVIPIGFFISILGGRYAFLGRPIFFFGLVFFGLFLVSGAVAPLKDDPAISGLLLSFDNIFLAILAGFAITFLFHSSSVFTGLVVLLAGSGLLTIGQAIPLILGSNLGTTVPSMLASSSGSIFAKRTAVAHLMFNLLGVLLMLPFLAQFTEMVVSLGGDAANQVANAHLIFNVVACVVFLAAVRPFTSVVERIVPGKEEEMLFKTKALEDKLPEETPEALIRVDEELRNMFSNCERIVNLSFSMLEAYSAKSFKDLSKLEAINDYLDMRIERAIVEISTRDLDKDDAFRVMLLARMSNSMEQLADIGAGLGHVAQRIAKEGGHASGSPLSQLNPIYSLLKESMTMLHSGLPMISEKDVLALRQNETEMRKLVNAAYLARIAYLREPGSRTDGSFVKAVSRMEAASAKLRDIRKLAELYTSRKGS